MTADRPQRPVGGLSQPLLAEWSSQFRPALLSFFRRRIAGGGDHEDLVQEVFLRLAKRNDLHDIRDVDRYIFHAAGNVLTDWRRRLATHEAGQHDAIGEDLPDQGFSPERLLLGRDALGRLISALETLPARTQAVFTLYHFEQKTHAEIGRTLGIAVRTVEDHMARANASLADAMDEAAGRRLR